MDAYGQRWIYRYMIKAGVAKDIETLYCMKALDALARASLLTDFF